MSDARPKKPRDLRLDFFRGLSLVAIFTAHVPGDWLAEIIWARFGLSDAAHVFVFISGYAAAMAFGGTFLRQGFATGTARIVWRCAQLYSVHMALFVLGAAICAWAATKGIDYAAFLGISDFFADPGRTLLGLFTLRYVPTYFDILPLYMLVLACVPLVLLLARIHPGLVIALSVAVWSFVQATGFNFDSGTSTGQGWGFNPLAWQMLFFTGFALSRGWVEAPRFHPALVAVCAAYLLFGFVAIHPAVHSLHPALVDLHAWAYSHAHKPNLDLRQYAHFLALAYVVLWAIDPRRELLASRLARPFVELGRQALPVFFAGMALAHVGGIAFAVGGDGLTLQVLVNAAGIGGLYAVARISAWVKVAPWKSPARAPVASETPVAAFVKPAAQPAV
ncbi:MAG: OpgC domain-containing protein [Rhodospirillales bacterium]|nr:OpgC domain-containing protein [Rhodospirillales bacterium]